MLLVVHTYHFITVWILLKGMNEEENLFWHMLLYLLDVIVWLLLTLVFRFDPVIYFLFSSSDTVSTPQNLVDTRNCHFFMCCLTLGIC